MNVLVTFIVGAVVVTVLAGICIGIGYAYSWWKDGKDYASCIPVGELFIGGLAVIAVIGLFVPFIYVVGLLVTGQFP